MQGESGILKSEFIGALLICSYLPVILSQSLLQRANARNVRFFTLYMVANLCFQLSG